MSQTERSLLVHYGHLLFLALVRLILALAFVLAVQPMVEGMEARDLPLCSQQFNYEIYPSPFYARDQTLFLRHYSWRDPHGFTLWRSSDGGNTWSVLLDFTNLDGLGMGPTYPVPIPPDPGFQLYLASHYSVPFVPAGLMLWYSDNGGLTWEARHPCDADCTYWLYPTNLPDVLFGVEHYDPWGHFSSGIWRTEDGARSEWIKVWDGTEAIGLAMSPDFAQDHTVFAGLYAPSPELGSPVIVSTDGGETWQGRGSDVLCDEAATLQLSPDFSHDQVVYMRQSKTLFRTHDAGHTWQVVFPPDRPHCQPGVLAPTVEDFQLSPHFSQDHTLFMVIEDEHGQYLLASVDGGATWMHQLRQSYYINLLWVLPEASASVHILDHPSQDEFVRDGSKPYAFEENQEWTTFLPQVTWSAGQPITRPLTLFIRAGDTADDVSLYRSDDGGVTWACMQLPVPALSSQAAFKQRLK